MTTQPHIAIAGGGPAGAVAALTLARRGYPVTVYEASPDYATKFGDLLPANAIPVLRQLGLFDDQEFARHHRLSHGIRCVWGSNTPQERHYLFEPYGPGWHLDRARFEEYLAGQARCAGAEWHVGTSLRNHHRTREGRWSFNAGHASADFLIDATGRRAALARSLGITRILDDRLIGVAQFFSPATTTESQVEAVETGWWYCAPLPQDQQLAIFFTDSDLIDTAQLRYTNAFRGLLAQTSVASLLHRATGTPRIFPAGTSHLAQLAGDGWLAIGDAAAAYDPLSSFGLTAAIGTGYYGACAAASLLNGEREAADAYTAIVDQSCTAYETMLAETYAAEQRWPNSPFWQRRHALLSTPADPADHPAPADRHTAAPADKTHSRYSTNAPVSDAANAAR